MQKIEWSMAGIGNRDSRRASLDKMSGSAGAYPKAGKEKPRPGLGSRRFVACMANVDNGVKKPADSARRSLLSRGNKSGIKWKIFPLSVVEGIVPGKHVNYQSVSCQPQSSFMSGRGQFFTK